MDNLYSLASQLAKVNQSLEKSNPYLFGNPFASTLQIIAEQNKKINETNKSFASVASLSSLGNQITEILAKQEKTRTGFEAITGLSNLDVQRISEAFSKINVYNSLVDKIQPRALENLLSIQSSLGNIVQQPHARIEPDSFSGASIFSIAQEVALNHPDAISLEAATKDDIENAVHELKNLISVSIEELKTSSNNSYEAGSFEQWFYTLMPKFISRRHYTIVATIIGLIFWGIARYEDDKLQEQINRLEQNSIETLEHERNLESTEQAHYLESQKELLDVKQTVDSLKFKEEKKTELMREMSIKLDSCTLVLNAILDRTKESDSNDVSDEEE
ncbi:MAG: hypothetical protein RL204_435 [Bacteroidota bacterium]|jgi:hypothetical protein